VEEQKAPSLLTRTSSLLLLPVPGREKKRGGKNSSYHPGRSQSVRRAERLSAFLGFILTEKRRRKKDV